LIYRRLLPPPISVCNVGKKTLRLAIPTLLLLTIGFAACTEDSPEPRNPYDATRTAADSTAAGDNIVVPPIQVDPTWADTLYYDYEGRPTDQPSS